jgi:sulfatase modifying factor 1
VRWGVIVAIVGAGCGRISFDVIASEHPDAPLVDASIDALTVLCAGHAGPASVLISQGAVKFCIDSTEVTNAQYETFINSSPSLASQPAYCAFNTTYVPTARWPVVAGQEQLPVAGMDWCDADAYCAWAGKRLCGRIGGGPVPGSNRGIPTQSEWTFACTMAGALTYPYGPAYQAGICVDSVYAVAGPTDVATATGCVGGFPGLYDMSGNITEWEDSCDTVTGSTDNCAYRGGEYLHAPDGTSCNVQEIFQRGDTFQGTGGFRCCSDAL